MIEAGSVVVIALSGPREKYWGRLVALTAVGVQVHGLDLHNVIEWARQIARQEPVPMALGTVFFPLSRVEKILLDEDAPSAPSILSQVRRLMGSELDDHLKL